MRGLYVISLLIPKLVLKKESSNQTYEYFIENDRVAGEKPFLDQGKKPELDEKPAGEGRKVPSAYANMFQDLLNFIRSHGPQDNQL